MSSAAKIGVFMLVVLAILAFFILRIEDIRIGRGESKTVTAVVDSAAGLNKGSDVRVAGVPIGKVLGIRLRPDGKAEVSMELDKNVQLHGNAFAKIANLGLLGEKYVEIDPGSSTAPVMTGEHVELRGGQVPSIDDVTAQVSAVAADVKAITESLRGVMAGPRGQQRLEDIAENIRQVTTQMREMLATNRASIDVTLANARIVSEQLRREVPRLADSLDSVARSLGGTVGENREDLRQIVENLRSLSADLRTTTQNMNAITGQVKSGEGTLGKLVYNDDAHERLTKALSAVESGVNELRTTLGRANRIQMDLGMKADYYAGLQPQDPYVESIGGNTRSEVMLRLNPNPERNRFYNIVLADDPRGKRRDKVFEETVTDPATGRQTTTVTHLVKFDRDFLLSAQAGWMLKNFNVRLGIFDNTGGGGIDYAYSNRIRLTGEVFDLGSKRDPNPHLRMLGEYVLRREKPRTPTIFVSGGIDNPLNDTSFVFGGGIRWRDDDLKYLVGSVPIGK